MKQWKGEYNENQKIHEIKQKQRAFEKKGKGKKIKGRKKANVK